MDKIYYDFAMYEKDITSLVYEMEKRNARYDIVVGVVRGGLVPAVHLSHILEATFVPLNWSSNVSRIRDKDNTLIHTGLERNRKVLVVDDICDTGVSLDDISKMYKGVDTAVLIHNKDNERKFIPTYHGWEMTRKEVPEWIDFWWEMK